MEVAVKQLLQNSKIIFPQTSAEAVLVKRGSTVITLDKLLNIKLESIETPFGSGLSALLTGQSVIILHSNPTIEPNNSLEPLLILHDSKGHIITKAPMGKFSVFVRELPIIETNGSEDKDMKFGDDFTADNGYIKLRWDHGNT